MMQARGTDGVTALEVRIGGGIPRHAQSVNVEEHVASFHIELFVGGVAVW